ncbi:hypothetical protein [Gryllotalpicola protaetiae]|uniref:Uncharacterized protein n=1 Tax=Gryllotalpicola protaetiae TaxID=2419771 RepID=A0A387BXI6_9MICO|nr:hypothetical protein [Gryllotalpicola protaetiae]AYG05557.1 hypothetical protein D7I44_17930 [Gryllotalpicola protaetiae]
MKRTWLILAGGFLTVVVIGAMVVMGAVPQNDAACAAGTASLQSASTHAAVDNYSGDQLANAAAIINAGDAMGVPAQGVVIGVMTAMGESSLQALNYGDKAGPDSRGLFQQRASWGTLAQRMDATTSADLFFTHLLAVPGWQNMTPTAAAHAVQRNADPNHYMPFYKPAEDVVAALAGTDAACADTAAAVSGDSRQLAQQIVDETTAGTIAWLTPSNFPEIQYAAEGRTVANCQVDPRILQVIQIAYKTFGKLGISDINRLCLNEHPPGSFNGDAHTANGGGHAVDFYAFGGTATNGADANAIKLIKALDPIMPAGHSGIGQENCRAAAGTSVTLAHMSQFADACTHLHVQVDPNNPAPLTVATSN